jgi:hypothetical protein
MHRRALLGDHLGSRGRAGDGALDRFARGAVVVILDLLVVGGQPVDEHAHANEQVVGLRGRDRAVFDTVGHGHRDRALRRSEHLHRLFGAFDRDLVEHHGRGFGQQVGRHDGQQRREAVLVVGQGMGERAFDG